MSKKFTKKALRLRGRAEIRRQKLKVDLQVKGRKTQLAEENLDAIRSLESKLKAIAAQQ